MRKNPYEILGVSDNASDEQIKEAYRNLARKYQSDNYSSGNLSEAAAAKMKEIDEAYDTIIMLRSGNTDYNRNSGYSDTRSNYGGSFGRRGEQGSHSYYNNGEYSDVRDKIRIGRLDDAEMLLDGISPEKRSAEWFFLKGSIQNRRGWKEEALVNYAKACRMAPDNAEYRAAYNNLNRSAAGGYRTGDSRKRGPSGCDVCTGLICADCCCECMGGDLIRCC